MEYKVIPFPRSKTPQESLQAIIQQNAVDGWHYSNHQYSDKLTPGKAGCFGVGSQPDFVVHVGMVWSYLQKNEDSTFILYQNVLVSNSCQQKEKVPF